VILTSAKINKSMGSMGMLMLNRKFPDYSVKAYGFVPIYIYRILSFTLLLCLVIY